MSIAGVALIATLVFGPRIYRQYQVSYHRQRLQLAMDHKLADAPSLDKLPVLGWFLPSSIPLDQSESYWEFEQAAKHRAALVELGELETQRFVLKHLKEATLEGRHFTRFLLQTTQDLDVYWESPGRNESAPLEFVFWCERGQMERWRQLIAKYDVPNYWEIRNQAVQVRETVREEL